MTVQQDIAERTDAPGSPFDPATLDSYVQEVIAKLAENGIIKKDAAGQPVAEVSENRSGFGAAQVTVEADMRPIGLAVTIPLRVTYDPDEDRIRWQMHSVPMMETPSDMPPVEAASRLTRARLKEAYERFLGPQSQAQGR